MSNHEHALHLSSFDDIIGLALGLLLIDDAPTLGVDGLILVLQLLYFEDALF
jgi:hypothetical protein